MKRILMGSTTLSGTMAGFAPGPVEEWMMSLCRSIVKGMTDRLLSRLRTLANIKAGGAI